MLVNDQLDDEVKPQDFISLVHTKSRNSNEIRHSQQ